MLSEKGYPKSLDYFNVSDFAELLNVYGNKPQKLAVVFPSDEIEDFFHTEYSEWGGTGDSVIKKRQCDGEICKFKYACEINGNKYAAGTSCECVCAALDLPQDHKQRCKCFMSLRAFVVNIKTGKIDSTIPYLFTSHSRNTADTIYSQIANIKALTHGHLTGIPFILSVTMREDMVDGQKKKYPIWSIQAFGTIEMVMNAAIAGILPTTDEHRIQIGEGAKQEVKQIAAATTPQDQSKNVHDDIAEATEEWDSARSTLREWYDKAVAAGKKNDFAAVIEKVCKKPMKELKTIEDFKTAIKAVAELEAEWQ